MHRATLDELAEQAGMSIPHIGHRPFSTFTQTLRVAQSVIDSPVDLRRVVTEAVDDAARVCVVWLELSLWPGFLGTRPGPPDGWI